jgi:hypothetical protein
MDILMRAAFLVVVVPMLGGCGDGELNAFSARALGEAPGAGGAGPPSGEDNAASNGGPQVFTTLLIDDFEDGDTRVSPTSESWWYIFNDSTGEQLFQIEDVSGQRANSRYSAHTYGAQFRAWGAGLGVDLAGIQDARNPEEPFDATQFAGISFWAKVLQTSVREIRVDLLSSCGEGCVSYSGVSIELATEWRQYTILFSELEPRQDESNFDQSRVRHIQFFFLDPERFDLWLDDLAVVSKYTIK